ncbi:hypothetical protein D3C87_1942330 [compost metagenome]
MNFDLVVSATARQLHMFVTRRNIGMTGQNTFAIFRFFNANLTQLIQTLRERTGKTWRHMLGNKNTGT